LAASAARIFRWDAEKGNGPRDTYNTLVVTQDQLEQIRQLREPVAYEAPRPETPRLPSPVPYDTVDEELRITS